MKTKGIRPRLQAGWLSIEVRWLAAIFLVALALRLAYLLLRPQTPVVFDAAMYYKSGEALAGISETRKGVNAALGRGPVYPLFLSLVLSAVPSACEWGIRYVQAGLSAFSCVLVYLIGKQLADRRVGYVAAGLTAIYPSFILYSGRILTETLTIFLVLVALFVTLRGMSAHSWGLLALAGGLWGLAGLTRGTLMPSLLSLVPAILVSPRDASLRRRVGLSLAFGGGLLLVLIAWNLGARHLDTDPAVSSSRIKLYLKMAAWATHPDIRGWAVQGREGIDEFWWIGALRKNPLYLFAAAGNLVFYHWWFADNAWREVLLLTPVGMHIFQRFLFLLGLGGLGISLRRWRAFLPVFLLLLGFSAMSVKWLEIRHTLPLIPLILILAALFVIQLVDWLRACPDRRTCAALIVGTVFTLILLVGSSSYYTTRTYLPYARSMAVVGPLSDALVIVLTILWAGLTFRVASRSDGRRAAVPVSIIPAGLFLLLFASYLHVGSEPRWHAWYVDVGERAVVQEITLPEPLDAAQIRRAGWLVDLDTDLDPAALEVLFNGEEVQAADLKLRPMFCAVPNDYNQDTCEAYATYANFLGRTTANYPQWWYIPIDLDLLDQSSEVSLTIRLREDVTVQGGAAGVRINGTFSPDIYSPALTARRATDTTTSLYRWMLTNDWRVWGPSSVAGTQTKSYLEEGQTRRLLKGTYNIRLRVLFRGGREVIY